MSKTTENNASNIYYVFYCAICTIKFVVNVVFYKMRALIYKPLHAGDRKNVVAVTARHARIICLKSDGTVVAGGFD